VAEAARGRRTLYATAGRRAGAEARQAPNVTAGRCTKGPSPVPPRAPNPSEPMIHGPGTFLVSVAGIRDRVGARRCSLPAGPDPVPADPGRCSLPLQLILAPRCARGGDSSRALKRVLRKTGLLSRSAAPPLQLDALRRPESRRPIDHQRSPPVVPTAFLVPVARFSVTRFPRIANLEVVHIRSRSSRHNLKPGTSHRYALSRAPRGTRITGPAEQENSRTGGCAVLENVPVSLRAGKGTFSRGAPSGIASRRSAPQPPRRPSSRPEVAGIARG
jgi:hypothetical protein